MKLDGEQLERNLKTISWQEGESAGEKVFTRQQIAVALAEVWKLCVDDTEHIPNMEQTSRFDVIRNKASVALSEVRTSDLAAAVLLVTDEIENLNERLIAIGS